MVGQIFTFVAAVKEPFGINCLGLIAAVSSRTPSLSTNQTNHRDAKNADGDNKPQRHRDTERKKIRPMTDAFLFYELFAPLWFNEFLRKRPDPRVSGSLLEHSDDLRLNS